MIVLISYKNGIPNDYTLIRQHTKKWIEIHDQCGETCNTNKQMRFKTSMLRSDLCDFNNAYILLLKELLQVVLMKEIQTK